MAKIRTVLVDDEYFNRELIKMMIQKIHADFEIVGECENVGQGLRTIAETSPDVVFLDVKMPDGSGFDLLQRLGTVEFEVVFVTGFDEFALKAFDHNALDYVLKPVDQDKLRTTLDRVVKRVTVKPSYLRESEQITYRSLARIPVHSNDKVFLLPVEDVMYARASEGCTLFYKSRDERYVSSRQLSDFTPLFERQKQFLRIDRATVINLDHMASYTKGPRCFINMKDGESFAVSRRKKAEVLLALETR